MREELKENVNHPSHYNIGKYEVIDVINDWKLNFNLGNVVKYVARADYKNDAIEDLEKAMFYLRYEIDYRRKPEEPYCSMFKNIPSFKQIPKFDLDKQELERRLKIKDEYLDLIIGIGFDYDGYDESIDGLKSVIDTLVDYAKKAINNDDTSIIYRCSGDSKKMNVLFEEI